ncbi:MAG: maleylpyruvate isomerase N-terminal domain-containing protein [Chloroflexota bacterium]|nr:maleylpyruvate isomerase N-terminal domain-containing protein [Chloroflexota bacterium]
MQATQISEAQALLEALDRVPPTALTACAGWTAHEVTAHLAAGADEIARLFEAFGEGLPVPPTRGFEEREAPYRAMDDGALRKRLFAASARMGSAMQAVLTREPEAIIPFTGMPFKATTFVLHSRSESAIHRWDLVGDDDISLDLLSRPEITEHAVTTLAPLLFSRGCGVAPVAGRALSARIRADGRQDIAIAHDSTGASLSLVPDDGSPAIETDAAARLLFIWGRRPGDGSRIRSMLPPDDRRGVEALLAGG